MGRLKFVDSDAVTAVKPSLDTLSQEFGRNLDTVQKARIWLTNPKNWHPGQIYILKWDGLICSISERHGRRLLNEPWDNGIPEVVVQEQYRLKRGGFKDVDAIGEVE